MNEQYEENGLVEEEYDFVEEDIIENHEYRFSWRKMLGWLAILIAFTSPFISVGISMICINTAAPHEKKEVSIVCYIACGIGAFFLLYDWLTRFI